MHKSKKAGFTLMEIMVAIVIVGVIASIAAVIYTNALRKTDVEKTAQRAQQVELFIKQLDILDVPSDKIVERINSNKDFKSFTLAEKTIGAFPYLKTKVVPGNDGVCADSQGSEGVAYTFLNLLDGTSKTPVTNAGVAGSVRNTNDNIHCTYRLTSSSFSLAILVDEKDHIWWCSNGGADDGGRYFTTTSPGQVRIACRYRDESDLPGVDCGDEGNPASAGHNRWCNRSLFVSHIPR